MAPNMKANIIWMKKMVKANLFRMMDQHILVIFTKIVIMEEVAINGLMAKNIMEHGKTIKRMDRE